MAEFLPAFERTMQMEGGYRLHTVEGDRGGMTYAGIARNYHENWAGWKLIDAGHMDNPDLTKLVRIFYFKGFWKAVRGNEIKDQIVANHIYDYAVNTGPRAAVKLLQIALKLTPDGIFGPKTLEAVNNADADYLILGYAFAKIVRYTAICNADRGQSKFLLGWLNRTIKGVA